MRSNLFKNKVTEGLFEGASGSVMISINSVNKISTYTKLN